MAGTETRSCRLGWSVYFCGEHDICVDSNLMGRSLVSLGPLAYLGTAASRLCRSGGLHCVGNLWCTGAADHAEGFHEPHRCCFVYWDCDAWDYCKTSPSFVLWGDT
jgi:hypothetical protein